jgi:hypothetical protein
MVLYVEREDHIDVWRVFHEQDDIPVRMNEPRRSGWARGAAADFMQPSRQRRQSCGVTKRIAGMPSRALEN